MVSRIFGIGTLVSILFTTTSVQAQDAATVDDAIRIALSRPEFEQQLNSKVEAVRASIEEAVAVPTPRIGLGHQQTFGDENVDDFELSTTIEQQFDLSGWRSALDRSGAHREAALRAEHESWRVNTAAEVRTAFYRVLYHKERIATLHAWVDELQVALKGVRAREKQGDASPYQVRRIIREIELARASVATATSASAESWSDLERWTGWSDRRSLMGILQPPTDASKPATAPHPELARLEHRRDALQTESSAWGSPMLRNWSVGAGYLLSRSNGSVGHGFTVSLSLPLSFWNTDAARLRRIRATETRIKSELAVGEKRIERETRAAAARLESIRVALAKIPNPSQNAELTQLAKLAFDAGEASLSELLDAFESETELQLARIDLQWEARRAAIALQRVRGIGAQP